MGLVVQGTKHVRAGTFSPIPDLQEGERGWRLNQLPVGDDLINSVCVMKPP